MYIVHCIINEKNQFTNQPRLIDQKADYQLIGKVTFLVLFYLAIFHLAIG